MSTEARRGAALAVLLVTAALFWEALLDILQQKEPDTALEWAVVAVCPVAAVLTGRWGFGKSGSDSRDRR